MEIEFNTSRIASRDSSQPTARADASPVAEQPSFPNATSLDTQLRELATVRPDKVAQAKSLLANTNYPPLELLDRIAHLIAVNIKH